MCEMYIVYSPLPSISFAVPLSSLTAPVDLPLLSEAYMYASAIGELFALSSSLIVKVLPTSTLAGNTQKHKMIKIIFIVCKGTMPRCCQTITTNGDLGWQKLRQMGINERLTGSQADSPAVLQADSLTVRHVFSSTVRHQYRSSFCLLAHFEL